MARDPPWLAGARVGGAAEPPVDVKPLHAKIGERTRENDSSGRTLGEVGLMSAKR